MSSVEWRKNMVTGKQELNDLEESPSQKEPAQFADGKSIMFFDGVCGLCNKSVQFVLKRDKADQFLFASLQSEFGKKVLSERGKDPTKLDTIYLVTDFNRSGERVLMKSSAIIEIAKKLGGALGCAATIFGVLPPSVRDFCYDCVASNRYKTFGKYDQCSLPSPAERKKFIDS